MDKDGLLSTNFKEGYKKYFTFLTEIKKRLFVLAAIFVVSTFVGFFYYERIINLILGTLNFTGVNIVFTSPFQFFTLAINTGILVGLIVTFPIILFQLLFFLKPALTKKEYKLIVTLIPVTLLLFIIGFIYGVAIMKYIVTIFYQKSVELKIGTLLDINLLLSKIILTGSFMGIAFEYPIVMTVLMRLKVIKYEVFTRQRFVAYSVAIIFAAFLPPTDLLSLIFLTIPLLMLFELTLLLNKVLLKSHLI